MGEVYRARDATLKREVAIKVLPAGSLGDEAARKRFRHEALALSNLSHPNIAVIHDFDTQEGVDFLVMEHIPGEPLSKRLAARALSGEELPALALQIASALKDAHEQGIAHGRATPEEIFPAGIMASVKI